MNKIKYIVTFAVGAAIGSAATYFIVNKKFEKLVQEEIKSVKEAFKRTECEKEVEEIVEEPDKVADDEMEYEDDEEYFVREEERDEYEELVEDNEYGVRKHQAYFNKPYVISPDEFGDMEDYETVGAAYYVDEVFANERGVRLDVEETISQKNLNYFGEYEEDMLYVRNPETKTDYEIFLDPRKYSEVYPGRV